jgi:hypothetical protein
MLSYIYCILSSPASTRFAVTKANSGKAYYSVTAGNFRDNLISRFFATLKTRKFDVAKSSCDKTDSVLIKVSRHHV